MGLCTEMKRGAKLGHDNDYIGKTMAFGFCDDLSHCHMDMVLGDGRGLPLQILYEDDVVRLISTLNDVLSILRGTMAMPTHSLSQ